MTDAQEVEATKKLGEEIGYGHLMCLASALWRKSLSDKGYPTNGAFVPSIAKKSDEKEIKLYDSIINEHI